jgi:hypothetical protein
MRRQLRAFYTPGQLAQLYAAPYDHTIWPDHVERVARTTQALDELAGLMSAETVADLSCGDGAIVLGSKHPWRSRILSDYSRYGIRLEDAIGAVQTDVFVCSETLEHVEDPDAVLAAIRRRCFGLVLTTPHGEVDDSNPEHYWSWLAGDLDSMLAKAGWGDRRCELFTPKSPSPYTFQLWMCR